MVTVRPLRHGVKSISQPSTAELSRLLRQGMLWVDVAAPTSSDMELLAKVFRFHRLSLDDCLNPVHYPKVEQFDRYLFIILHTLESVDGFHFHTTGVDFFITTKALVTVHQRPSQVLESVAQHLAAGALAAAPKPDLLFHLIADRYVQEYLPVLDALDDEITSIEDAILLDQPEPQSTSTAVTKRILKAKKRITNLKRLHVPQREVFSRLGRGEFNQVGKVAAVYCRDTYDSLFRITEMLDTFRDVLSSTLEAYLSVVSNRLNEVMKVLTIVTVIILPPTLIAGIYGMNFHNMPELASPWGYPVALGLMLVTAVGMVLYFRRRRWL